MRISYTKKIIPIIAFAILGGITVALWLSQKSHRRQLLLHHAETSAEQLRVRIEGMTNAHCWGKCPRCADRPNGMT